MDEQLVATPPPVAPDAYKVDPNPTFKLDPAFTGDWTLTSRSGATGGVTHENFVFKQQTGGGYFDRMLAGLPSTGVTAIDLRKNDVLVGISADPRPTSGSPNYVVWFTKDQNGSKVATFSTFDYPTGVFTALEACPEVPRMTNGTKVSFVRDSEGWNVYVFDKKHCTIISYGDAEMYPVVFPRGRESAVMVATTATQVKWNKERVLDMGGNLFALQDDKSKVRWGYAHSAQYVDKLVVVPYLGRWRGTYSFALSQSVVRYTFDATVTVTNWGYLMFTDADTKCDQFPYTFETIIVLERTPQNSIVLSATAGGSTEPIQRCVLKKEVKGPLHAKVYTREAEAFVALAEEATEVFTTTRAPPPPYEEPVEETREMLEFKHPVDDPRNGCRESGLCNTRAAKLAGFGLGSVLGLFVEGLDDATRTKKKSRLEKTIDQVLWLFGMGSTLHATSGIFGYNSDTVDEAKVPHYDKYEYMRSDWYTTTTTTMAGFIHDDMSVPWGSPGHDRP